jgi:hypothetical protein
VTVWVACVLVWLEACVALAGATAFLAVLFRGTDLAGATAGLAVIALGVCALLVGGGLALLRGGRRWARSPVLTVQLLLVALSVAGWSSGTQPWPAVGVVLAVAIVVALLTPSAVRWTAVRRPTSEEQ